MKAAVRFGAVVSLWGLVACASGAPAAESRDSGVKIPPPASGSGGSGGSAGGAGAGSGGAGAGSGGSAGSAGSAGRAGAAGSKPTIPPIVDSGPPDAGSADAAPTVSCDDGKKNGKETSADCGGADCDKCADGKSCVTNDDCESGSCSNAFTCVTPGCGDGQLNQDESDTDCGGTCSKCAVGKKCNAPADCMSGMCDSAGRCACVPTATCDADECGSKPDGCGAMLTCATCPDGQRCNNRMCVCDANQCDNNCSFLQSQCCKNDGMCGCRSLISSCQ